MTDEPNKGGSIPSPEEASDGYQPLEAEMETADEGGVYPPDIAPEVDIGGSPEEQAALRDEYRHPRQRP